MHNWRIWTCPGQQNPHRSCVTSNQSLLANRCSPDWECEWTRISSNLRALLWIRCVSRWFWSQIQPVSKVETHAKKTTSSCLMLSFSQWRALWPPLERGRKLSVLTPNVHLAFTSLDNRRVKGEENSMAFQKLSLSPYHGFENDNDEWSFDYRVQLMHIYSRSEGCWCYDQLQVPNVYNTLFTLEYILQSRDTPHQRLDPRYHTETQYLLIYPCFSFVRSSTVC